MAIYNTIPSDFTKNSFKMLFNVGQTWSPNSNLPAYARPRIPEPRIAFIRLKIAKKKLTLNNKLIFEPFRG